jgi:hypothetical protein
MWRNLLEEALNLSSDRILNDDIRITRTVKRFIRFFVIALLGIKMFSSLISAIRIGRPISEKPLTKVRTSMTTYSVRTLSRTAKKYKPEQLRR